MRVREGSGRGNLGAIILHRRIDTKIGHNYVAI